MSPLKTRIRQNPHQPNIRRPILSFLQIHRRTRKRANSSNQPADDNSNSIATGENDWPKRGFNGRVIMINAVLRSSPSIDSPEVSVIPFDEPIKSESLPATITLGIA